MLMSDSDVINSIKYQNSKGENLLDSKQNNDKKMTTDTDYYFNLIANPVKMVKNNNTSSESSEIESILKNTDTDNISNKSLSNNNSSTSHKTIMSNKSESKPIYEEINFSTINNNNSVKFKPTVKIQETIEQNPHKKSVDFTIPDYSNNKSFQNNISESVEPKQLSPQEIRMKKIELLRKLSEIKLKGYQLSKEYDFNSSLEEMEYEYELLKSFADKRNGVKIFKNGLLQMVSVVEFLNDKYDPFEFQLSGWSEHLTIEIDSWEDVLEEIYEKYKGSGRKMAPEIKLIYLMIASASAFHFSKSYAANLPGLDSILASNPGLLSKIINPKNNNKSQFMTKQEINIEKQKEELHKKEIESKKKMLQQQQYIKGLQHKINQQNNIIQSLDDNYINTNNYDNSSPLPANLTQTEIKSIKAPDDVKEILNRIHTLSGTIKNNIDTQEELSSNNDRLISETTISENFSKKKQQKKIKKANIVIN